MKSLEIPSINSSFTIDNLDPNKESSEKKKEAILVGKDVIQVQDKKVKER